MPELTQTSQFGLYFLLVAGCRKLVDVAQDRALGHFHRLRQRAGRHAAVRLQQHQDREQAAGFHRRLHKS